MSKKKAAKSTAKGGKGDALPHKTLKKSVQQVSKTQDAESLSDLKRGKTVAAIGNTAKKGGENSIKSQLLPKVLAEFEDDAKQGARRSALAISEAIGFDAKQVVKYVSHYEKEAYAAWKSLPKADAKDKPKSAEKKEKAKQSNAKSSKPTKAQSSKIVEIPDDEETTSPE